MFFLAVLPSSTQTGGSDFVNFEAALTNPIRLSADGTRLYCVNNPNGTLSVFDVASNPGLPSLLAEIPVGVEPVSVNPRTNDEVWVVNQESDSVSIVSVSRGVVIDTINVKDEPSDVVFAGANAFVSVARDNLVNVYNALTHRLVKAIPVFGGAPRAMAVSSDASTVYAAFAISGNGTTLIPTKFAPVPPPPVNPRLPAAPQQGIIVAANDPEWSGVVNFTVPDNDVVAISSSSLAITGYYTGVGTVNLGIAVQPGTGNLFVANTDALNLVRFVTSLKGHFVNNRISKITPSGTVTAYDLNPTVTYTNLPDPSSIAIALSQPAGIAFDATGQNMYVAAFGTDRVAKVDANGNVLDRIEIDPQAIGSVIAPATKRGPRGLAINNNTNILYVLNRISNTISIVNTSADTVLGEIPTGSHDPTPASIKSGRGFLYDAKLSGNGTGSCGACHIDGEGDHLGWDLGDPTGTLFAVIMSNGKVFAEHPMKGPMTTLTLRGLVNEQPFHWRGDKPTFADFNVAFQDLMGGAQLSTSDMTAFSSFIDTIAFMPNPYQNLDRTYPARLQGGNAQTGAVDFTTFPVSTGNTCNTCHLISNFGSNLQILVLGGENQPMKNTLLRSTYQKQLFTETGANIDGFGILHDGSGGSLRLFLGSNIFPGLKGNPTVQNDLAAFNLSMDTGAAPAVGFAHTLSKKSLVNSQITADWSTLESQAVAQNCDLIAQGTANGQRTSLLYVPAQASYTSQQPGVGPFSHAQLVTLIQNGDILTVMGVPLGSGLRIASNP